MLSIIQYECDMISYLFLTSSPGCESSSTQRVVILHISISRCK